MPWKFWEKERFELVDVETKDVVETMDDFVSKDAILQRIADEDLPDCGYKLVGAKGKKTRVLWSIRKKKEVVEKKTDAVKKMSKDEAMAFLKKEGERLQEEVDSFEKMKETVVNTFHPGVGSETIIDNPMEGLKKGIGTALFRGLTKNPEEVTERVFGTLDAATLLMKGAGLMLAKKAGISLAPEITQKKKKKEDGTVETELDTKEEKENV